jgi:hypothetical protein
MGKCRCVALRASAAALAFGVGSSVDAEARIINFGQTSGTNTFTAIGNVSGTTAIDANDALVNIARNRGGLPVNGVYIDLAATATDTASIPGSNLADSLTSTSSAPPARDLSAPSGRGFPFANVTPVAHISHGTVTGFTAGPAENASASAIPELSTWAMLALGFAGLGYAGFRGRKTKISIF